ncbi:baculoviral IAP repeat-containing protein 7 [Patella vulgata]|uniref:baculoviral IAP repeat-containing protein 7 n=1 Tax=Patella vulgata TaxID=6465 RepID=UPI0024A93FE3|nr:baculoviral IAP repeat-containing protein 7 [Patella vulgata]
MTSSHQSLPLDVLKQSINQDLQPTSDCMKYEWMRLGSFKSFPRQSEGRPIKLAKAGFVFTGTREGDDTVTCFTCGVTKNNWLKYEDPPQVHKNLNPRCNFINDNVPVLVPESIVYDKIWTTLHETYCDGNRETRSSSPFCTGINSRITDPTIRQTYDIPPILLERSDINQAVQVTDDRTGPDVRSRMVLNQSMSSASVVLTADSTRHTMVVEEARLRTFGNWPRYLAVRPTELARAGFYYLGSADRVQCAFCRGILRDWEEAESPVAEHWRYFSSCEFLRGTDRSNVPIIPNDSYIHDYVSTHPLSSTDEDVRTALNPLSTILKNGNLNLVQSDAPATAEDLGIITQTAAQPDKAILATRVATFSNWPRRSPLPSKEQIAEAGFYYLEREDAVKCFFCGGVLKSWRDDDIPWQEHAKWFPKCPYLLRIKGADFVNSIYYPGTGTAKSVGDNGATGNNGMIVQQMLDLPLVKEALKLQINKALIIKAIENRMRNGGQTFKTTSELINDILDLDRVPTKHEDIKDDNVMKTGHPLGTNGEHRVPNDSLTAVVEVIPAEPGRSDTAPRTGAEPNLQPGENEESSKLVRENEELKERRICKICMDAESNIVLLPCGHLVACESCAPALTKCPMCRKSVRGSVKTYLS